METVTCTKCRMVVNLGAEQWIFDVPYCPICADKEQSRNSEQIRTFETGATRDVTRGKLDYVKALSPIVLRRYVQYLDKHRLQSDGSYRDFNNWKKGIPQETYRSSNGRHFIDDWLLSEGYATEDNHGPITDIEDVICAKIFNDMGRLHEILKARFKEEADYQAAIDHETGGADVAR